MADNICATAPLDPVDFEQPGPAPSSETKEERRKRLARVRQQRFRLTHGDECRAKQRARYAMKPEQSVESSRRWRYNNPDSARNTRLRKEYGITLEQYEQIEKQQRGLCAICGCPETAVDGRRPGRVLRLAVDHCHASGVIRGLLCCNCNQAIGKMKDSPDRLRAAATYLEGSLA